MDALDYRKYISKDWERYIALSKKTTFQELKEAIEKIKSGHSGIIMIPDFNHIVLTEDIDLEGYVTIFCGKGVTLTNDRDHRGFTTGINFKDGSLNIINGMLITTKKSSYFGFLSGSGYVKTFETDIHIYNGSLLTGGFLTTALSLSINGGEVKRFGAGYLAEDGTGQGVPVVLDVAYPNNIDEDFINCENLVTNLFLPKQKGGKLNGST